MYLVGGVTNIRASSSVLIRASLEILKHCDDEKANQFVIGFDDSRFGGLCTNLVGTDPVPSLSEVYSKVIIKEYRLSSSRGGEKQCEAVGFVARQNESCLPCMQQFRDDDRPSILRSRERAVLCAHCGRNGHDKKECWQLIGFPDWWVERSERSGGRGANGRVGGHDRGQPIAAHAESSNASSF